MSEPIEFCYGYPDFSEAQLSIDELNLPYECSNALRRTGIELIGDVLDVIARIFLAGGMGAPRMSPQCYPIVLRTLLSVDGCPMREEMQQWLDEWY
jgi:hypothetical protein